MRAPIFQVDAFTTCRFAGNPAAVMLLKSFPPDEILLALAAEITWPKPRSCAAGQRLLTPLVTPCHGSPTLQPLDAGEAEI